MTDRLYQVWPREGLWVVWESGGMLIGSYASKEAAVQAGCDHAKARDGTVFVHRDDGSVEETIDCRGRPALGASADEAVGDAPADLTPPEQSGPDA